jgi:hypothetical protein
MINTPLDKAYPRAAKIIKRYGLELYNRNPSSVTLAEPGKSDDDLATGLVVKVWNPNERDAYIAEEWMLDGALHRDDGPAVTTFGGSQHWYLNGNSLSEEEWRDATGN